MLSVNKEWRRKGIAKRLILLAVEAMKANGADEVRGLCAVFCTTMEDRAESCADLELYSLWAPSRADHS